MFLLFNEERIKSAVYADGRIMLNGIDYKIDVADFTGYEEKYIFVNPHNGRFTIENNGKRAIYKLEVALYDENC